MRPFRFHPEALEEADVAAEFYEERQQGLGTRFVKEMTEAISRIRMSPAIYRKIEDDVSMSLFLRLLKDEEKGAALEAAVRSVVAGEPDGRVFEVEPTSFEQVPGAPFAYWVSEQVRQLFNRSPPLQSTGRVAVIGASTKDDGRFLRLWYEVLQIDGESLPSFAKGGAFSPFYADVHLCIRWRHDGAEAKQFVGDYRAAHGWSPHWKAELHNPQFYFRPGLTWPRRTNGLSFRVMPAGCIFADKGPAAFVDDDDPESLLALCAVINSEPFKKLVELQLARTELAQSFEVGLIQRTPVPELSAETEQRLARLARRAWTLKRDLDTAEPTSHAFALPALLQVPGDTLADRAAAWAVRETASAAELRRIQSEIDDRCFDLYGFDAADRAAAPDSSTKDSASSASPRCHPALVAAELFDWLVGVAFGRFDLRLATGARKPPAEPEPFDPLPVCSPGMLTGGDGLPLDAPPPGYPLDFPADGILVDDAGMDGNRPGPADIVVRIRQVLEVLTAETPNSDHQDSPLRPPRLCGENPEPELCSLLGVRTLRDWLRRPSAYFADHIGRYSKSRRKAPICWPLSTESGSWNLWLYYPRLTGQTLYSCVNEHVDPKLQETGRDIVRLRGIGQPGLEAQKQIDALVELQRELEAMREELLQVAKLPYKPDQNDGVLITAAPLWRLFRHKPWQKNLRKSWDELEAGKYDWSHLAYTIWPDRVRDACKKDNSIAIAHGLEELFDKQD